MTREEWIKLAADRISKDKDLPLPTNILYSMSFPGGGSPLKRIGECWESNGTTHVFVSPTLNQDSERLSTLVHELVHASVGVKAGHGKAFKRIALKVGLTGKMRSTTAGPELTAYLERLVGIIGRCPTKTIDLKNTTKQKQGTRMIKCECLSCGYVVRTTRQWLESGAPICPCSMEPMEVSDGDS